MHKESGQWSSKHESESCLQSDPFEQGHKSSIKQETTIQWKDEHLNADDDDDFDNSTSLPEAVCYNSVNLFFRPKAKYQPGKSGDTCSLCKQKRGNRG